MHNLKVELPITLPKLIANHPLGANASSQLLNELEASTGTSNGKRLTNDGPTSADQEPPVVGRFAAVGTVNEGKPAQKRKIENTLAYSLGICSSRYRSGLC